MSQLHVEHVEQNVQWYDPQSMLTPRTMRTIVQAVAKEMEAREEHRDRVSAETRVNTGLVS